MNGISTYNYNAWVPACPMGMWEDFKNGSPDTSKFIKTSEANQHTSIDSDSFLIKPLHNIEQFSNFWSETVNY